MTDRELMQQALEALESTTAEWKSLADSGDAGFWKAEDQDDYKQCISAIAALRERLAKPDIEVNSERMSQWVDAALGERRVWDEQPYANKAAYIESATNGRVRIDPATGEVSIGARQADKWPMVEIEPVLTVQAARQEQEPVAWMVEHDKTDLYWRDPPANAVPLYTAPQPALNLKDKSVQRRLATQWGYDTQREWVGLTEEEIKALRHTDDLFEDVPMWSAIARAIEAALREKNNG